MFCPRAALFDLDDTLSAPHIAISAVMAKKLCDLLALIPVAIVSAAPFERVSRDVLENLQRTETFDNLYVFSENGGMCRTWGAGHWRTMYQETLSPNERITLRTTVEEVVKHAQVLEGAPIYGERILDREAGVTLSTLGLGAPQDARKAWDPERTKREVLRKELAGKLPDWNVYIGGLTSIDISRHNVSKARAVMWLAEQLHCKPADMIYVGDALYEGGNDTVVIPTGVHARSVSGPAGTETLIDEMLAECLHKK